MIEGARLFARRVLPAAAMVLAGCSMDRIAELPKPQLPSFDWSPYSRATLAESKATKINVGPADMVNAEGICAAIGSDESPGQIVGTGIALQMTECSLVRLLGSPEKIEIGANERGDRTATLLYSSGERPGLYQFTGGQLTAIQRVAEPPPPPKPPRPAPQAKPRRTAS